MSRKRTASIPAQKKNADGKPLCRWCDGLVTPPRRTFCSQDCVDEALIRSNPGHLRMLTKKRDKGICRACGIDTEAMKQQYRKLWAISGQGITAYAKLVKQAKTRWGIELTQWHPLMGDVTVKSLQASIDHMNQQWESKKGNQRFGWADRYYPDQIAKMEADILKIQAIPNHEHISLVNNRLKRLAEARRARLQAEHQKAGWDGFSKYGAKNLWQADHIKPVEHGGGLCGLENIQTLCTPCHKLKTKRQARLRAEMRRGLHNQGELDI